MTNFKLTLLAAASILIFSMTVFSSDAAAQNARRQRYSAQQRAQIRATPILERPSRPFHFYGNTVRRNAGPKTTPKSGSASQVASSPTPASIDTSTVAKSEAAVGVAAESATKTERRAHKAPIVNSSAFPIGKASIKSVLAPQPKSVLSIEDSADLRSPITIHLTDLGAEQTGK